MSIGYANRAKIAIVTGALVAVLTVVRLAFLGSAFAPSPHDLCGKLVNRQLAKNCADDQAAQPFGGRASTFELVSSGHKGRIVTFGDAEAYKHALHSIAADELWSTSSNHFGTKRAAYVFASKAARCLIFVPTPIDRIDEADFAAFEATALGPDPAKSSAREHPIHSDACKQSVGCAEDGKCAIYPSEPTVCVAGFNEDCIASAICAKSDKCNAFSDGTECH